MEQEVGNSRTRYVAILTRDFFKPNVCGAPANGGDGDMEILEKVAEEICKTYADIDIKLAYVYPNNIVLYLEPVALFIPLESSLASIATMKYMDACLEKETKGNSSSEDDSFSLYKIHNMARPSFTCHIEEADNEKAIDCFKKQNEKCIRHSKTIYENWEDLLSFRKYGVFFYKEGECCDGRYIAKTYAKRTAKDFIKNDSILREALHMDIEQYDAKELKEKYEKTYEMLMEHSKEDLANYIACQTLFGKQKLEN